jgi:hypothetical protein
MSATARHYTPPYYFGQQSQDIVDTFDAAGTCRLLEYYVKIDMLIHVACDITSYAIATMALFAMSYIACFIHRHIDGQTFTFHYYIVSYYHCYTLMLSFLTYFASLALRSRHATYAAAAFTTVSSPDTYAAIVTIIAIVSFRHYLFFRRHIIVCRSYFAIYIFAPRH